MINSIVGKSKDADAARQLRNQSNGLQAELNDLYQKQIDGHEDRLMNLEDNMRINGVQEMNVKSEGNRAVVKVLGGKDTNAYEDKKTRSKAYSAMWRRFKKRFGIPRYGELAAKDFEEAIEYLKSWRPDRELELEINNRNRQESLNFKE